MRQDAAFTPVLDDPVGVGPKSCKHGTRKVKDVGCGLTPEQKL